MKHKLRTVLASLALVSALALGGGTLASAEMIAPGPAFGGHVSMMAMEGHPILHGGQEFGDCVSIMAQGNDCSHEH